MAGAAVLIVEEGQPDIRIETNKATFAEALQSDEVRDAVAARRTMHPGATLKMVAANQSAAGPVTTYLYIPI